MHQLPDWLSKTASPILVIVVVLSAVLELQELLSLDNAVAISVTFALISCAWAYHAWTQRANSKIYGSVGTHRIYGRAVRYGSLSAAILTLSVASYLFSSTLTPTQAHENEPPMGRVPFEIFNGAQTMPIWIGREADIHVLRSRTPLEAQVIEAVRARVDMPDVFRFGERFQIEPGEVEHGLVLLPKRFNIQAYQDQGLTIRLLVVIEPTGTLIHGDSILDDELYREGINLAFSP